MLDLGDIWGLLSCAPLLEPLEEASLAKNMREMAGRLRGEDEKLVPSEG